MFCKNCGSPISPDEAFCPNCGRPTQQPTAQAAPVESPTPSAAYNQAPQQAPKRGSRKMMIIALIVIVLLIGAGAAYYLVGPSSATVNVTEVDETIILSSGGQHQTITNTFNGFQTRGASDYVYALTFGGGNIAQSFTVTIESITVNTQGFTLKSVSPSLPATVTLSPGSSTSNFNLDLQTPSSDFNGPISITLQVAG